MNIQQYPPYGLDFDGDEVLIFKNRVNGHFGFVCNKNILKNACINYLFSYKIYYIIPVCLYVTIDRYVTNNFYVLSNCYVPSDCYKNLNIVFENLCKGLQTIHENNIVHRDINMYNVLINPSTLNIRYTDFKLSQSVKFFDLNRVGTIAFVDPMIYYVNEPCFKYLKKFDIYALGILLFFIIRKKTPFQIFVNNLPGKSLKCKIERYFMQKSFLKSTIVDNVLLKVNELRSNKIIMKNLLSKNLTNVYYCEK